MTAQGNGPSEAPSISSDGRRVAYVSRASNLAGPANLGLAAAQVVTAVEDGSGRAQVLMWGEQTGTSTTESATASGEPGNGDSSHPEISDDGGTVAFVSEASNLVSGDTNGVADSFKKTVRGGAPERTSVGPNNQQLPRPTTNTAIAGNGRAVASEVALPPTPGDPDRRGLSSVRLVLVLQQMTSPAGLVDLVTITVIEGIGIDAGAQVLIDGVALPPADVVRESDRRLRVAMPPARASGA